ncbi:unnamed protein product [Musa acuminata subsp. burmannicoides]
MPCTRQSPSLSARAEPIVPPSRLPRRPKRLTARTRRRWRASGVHHPTFGREPGSPPARPSDASPLRPAPRRAAQPLPRPPGRTTASAPDSRDEARRKCSTVVRSAARRQGLDRSAPWHNVGPAPRSASTPKVTDKRKKQGRHSPTPRISSPVPPTPPRWSHKVLWPAAGEAPPG